MIHKLFFRVWVLFVSVSCMFAKSRDSGFIPRDVFRNKNYGKKTVIICTFDPLKVSSFFSQARLGSAFSIL